MQYFLDGVDDHLTWAHFRSTKLLKRQGLVINHDQILSLADGLQGILFDIKQNWHVTFIEVLLIL